MISGKRVLIVGAGGLVGVDVALLLSENDNEVIATSRWSNDDRKTVLETAGISCLRFEAGKNDLEQLPRDVDYVYLMQVVHRDADDRPLDAFRVNALFTGEAATYFRDSAGIIATGTFNTYGAPGESLHEEAQPQPRTVYEASRHAQEIVLRRVGEQEAVPSIVLRICYGQHPEYGLIGRLAEQIREGRTPAGLGRYLNLIDHRDLVRYLALSAEHATVPMNVVNLSSEKPMRAIDLLKEVATRLGKQNPPFDEAAAQAASLSGPCEKLVKLMGPPQYSLDDTLTYVLGD